MASTYTPNLNLELQGTGDHVGTWGGVVNTNDLTVIDTAMGGVQTLTLSTGNTNVTTTQSQNNAFLLTGTLTGNCTVTFPAIGRTYYIANNTTGAFSVTLKTSGGGASVVIPQGASGFYVLNVNDVLQPTLPGVPVGTIVMYGAVTPPSGWLECDGSAISRSTYAGLFAVFGTTFGPGDGSTTFNLPDSRGYFMRGYDHGRGVDPARVFGSTQADAYRSHTHTFTGDALPTHQHTADTRDDANSPSGGYIANNNGSNGGARTIAVSAVSAGTPTGTNAASGGAETRPYNLAVLFIVKAL